MGLSLNVEPAGPDGPNNSSFISFRVPLMLAGWALPVTWPAAGAASSVPWPRTERPQNPAASTKASAAGRIPVFRENTICSLQT
jgi:hypothetical protein